MLHMHTEPYKLMDQELAQILIFLAKSIGYKGKNKFD